MIESIEIKRDALFSMLMSGDECGARMLVQRSLRGGRSPQELLREVMFPLAIEAEKLQRAEQIDPAAYESVRRQLRRLACEVREVHEEIEAACGTCGQFVEITVRHTAARARIIDRVADARRAQIISAEIRGAMEALVDRTDTLVLDFSTASVLTSAALAMCMHVQETGRTLGVRVILYGLCSASARLIRQTAGRGTLVAANEERLERLLAAA